MKLVDYLDSRFAVPDVRPDSVRRVLRQLVAPLAGHGAVEDVDGLMDALLERESLQSTGIGSGVAVPHAICDELAEPRIVLGRCAEGVDFRSLDQRPVHLFFLLLSPSTETGVHIKLLARIARLVRHPELLEEVRESTDAAAMIGAIQAYEREHV